MKVLDFLLYNSLQPTFAEGSRYVKGCLKELIFRRIKLESLSNALDQFVDEGRQPMTYPIFFLQWILWVWPQAEAFLIQQFLPSPCFRGGTWIEDACLGVFIAVEELEVQVPLLHWLLVCWSSSHCSYFWAVLEDDMSTFLEYSAVILESYS